MDVRATVAAHWDGRAATFDDEADHGLVDPATRAAWTRHLLTWLPDPSARVADLGCGTGSLAVLLASRGYEVTACDISAAMVERARRKASTAGVHLELAVADAASPGLAARSTDVVLVRHLAWTLPHPRAAIATWRSLLRAGGRLVMIEGRWGTPAQADTRADAQADPQADDVGIDHGDYTPVHRELPWYGGVGSATLIPFLERTFARVEHHDLTTHDDLWGRPVGDERYAVVAHLG